MGFVTRLLVSINWKDKIYHFILLIVDQLTKIVYYELVKINIKNLGLAKFMIDVIIWHHGLVDFILSDYDSVFISKFWLSLYYFWKIKQRLFTTFHPQIDS